MSDEIREQLEQLRSAGMNQLGAEMSRLSVRMNLLTQLLRQQRADSDERWNQLSGRNLPPSSAA